MGGLALCVGYIPFMVWSLFYFALAFVGIDYGLTL